MPDCSGVNVNPVSGELILRWRSWLQIKGSLPLALALTYRAKSTRSGAWGKGFFSPLIAHLEVGDETIQMVKDSGHVTQYVILGSGAERQFVPAWDKYNELGLDGDGHYVETRRAIGTVTYDDSYGRIVCGQHSRVRSFPFALWAHPT